MRGRPKARANWPVMNFRGIVKKIDDFTFIVDPFKDVWHVTQNLNVCGCLTIYYSVLNKRFKDLVVGGLYEFSVGVSVLKNDGAPRLGFLYLSHVTI